MRAAKVFFTALVLFSLLGWGFYRIRDHVRENTRLSAATAAYLFEPTDVLGLDGKPLRRVDLIDGVLKTVYAKKP